MKKHNYEKFKRKWMNYDRARRYAEERFSRSRRWRKVGEKEKQFVANFLSELTHGSIVLDAPCGTGRFVPLTKDLPIKYVGSDISPQMVHFAKKESEGSRASFVIADLTMLPFKDGAFDALLVVRILHRIQERAVRLAMLHEISRVCRGRALVTYYSFWNLRSIMRWLRGKFAGLTMSAIRDETREAGLQIEEATPVNRFTEQQWFLVVKRVGG